MRNGTAEDLGTSGPTSTIWTDRVPKLRSRASAFVVLAIVCALLTSAVRSNGVPTKKMRFNDSSVWELNRSAGRARHWNMKVRLAGSMVNLPGRSKALYLEQGPAGIVVLDRGAQTVHVLNDRDISLQNSGVKVGAVFDVRIAREFIYVISAKEGRVYKVSAEQLSGTESIESAPILVDLKHPIRVELGSDERLHILDLTSGELQTWNNEGKRTRSVSLGKVGKEAQLTAIGPIPIVLDEEFQTVHVGQEGLRSLPLKGKGRLLAIPTKSLREPITVVAANGDGDVEEIDISGKKASISPIIPGIGANPIRPVVEDDGCIVGASSATGRVGGVCPNDNGPNAQREAFDKGHELHGFLVRGEYFVDDLDSNRGSQRGPDGKPAIIVNGSVDELETPEENPDGTQSPNPASGDAEVVEINKKPKAVADELAARPDRTTVLPVLLNDLDPNGDSLAVVAVAGVPASVTAEPALGGQGVVFRPQPGFLGRVSFRVTVADPDGETDTASAVVTVDDLANNAPLAIDDVATASNTRLSLIDVLANDRDLDGDTISVLSARVVSGSGDVSVGSSGVIAFKPTSSTRAVIDYVVRDERGETAKAKVVIDVRGTSNLPPIARDDLFEVPIGSTTVLDLLANDLDPDGSLLSITDTPLSIAPLGSLQREGNLVRFNASQQGTQIFTYRVSDRYASSTARVRLVVKPSVGNHPPLAIPDRLSLSPGAEATVDVVRNDTDADGDVLGVVSWTAPRGVTVSSSDNRRLLIRIDSSVDTPRVVLYEASDGTAVVTGTLLVSPVPVVGDLAPVAQDDTVGLRLGAGRSIRVLANDADPEGGTLRILGLNSPPAGVTLSPDARSVIVAPGSLTSGVSFRYTIGDLAGNEAGANVVIEVVTDRNQNRSPIARADRATVRSGFAVVVPVTANDEDPDGDSIAVKDQGSPSKGTVSIVNGSIRYEANAGAVGTDRFVYTLDDGRSSTVAEVSIGILPAPRSNRAPVANDDGPITVKVGQSASVDVLANDIDPDKDPLRLTNVSEPSDGSSTFSGSSVSLTAGATAGDVKLRYTITDAGGATARAFVIFRVVQAGSGQPPVANPDSTPEMAPGSSAVVAVLENDTDPDGDRASLVVVDVQGAGVEVGEDKRGLIVTAGATASSATYTVRDSQGNLAKGTISIVVGTGSSLVAVDDASATTASQSVEIDVLANDRSSEALKPLQIVKVGSSSAGVPAKLGSKISFRPKGGFAGDASFTYTVSDKSGATKTANVRVVVSGGAKVNRPPAVKASALISLLPGTSKKVDLASLASDPDGSALRFTLGNVPTQVSARLGGTVVTISAPKDAGNWTGSLPFTATDPAGASNTNAVFVEIVSQLPAAATTRTAPQGTMVPSASAVAPTTQTIVTSTTVSGVGPTVPGVAPTVAPQTTSPGTTAAVTTTAPTTIPPFTTAPPGTTIPPITTSPGTTTPRTTIAPVTTTTTIPLAATSTSSSTSSTSTSTSTTSTTKPPGSPGIPIGVNVGSATASSLTISWSPPADNGGAPITRYELSLDGGTGNPDTGTTQTWTLLPPNTIHSFQVRACNSSGCSANSASVSGKTLAVARVPETPTGVSVGGATNSSLTISWSPSANPDGMAPPDRYEVSMNSGGPNPGQALSQTWTGLASGTTFSLQVRGCNSAGCSPYSAALTGKTTGTPPVVDRAPGVMAAPSIGSPTVSSLTVNFAPPSELGIPATIARYEGQANGGAVISIGSPPSFTWNGLVSNTTHSIVVRACNGTAATTCGPWSAAGSGKTSEQPRVPGQMAPPVIQDNSQTSIRIGFNAPGDVGVPGPILRYEGLITGGATADISTSGTFVWGGLAAGTTYTFQVRACNATDCAPWSGGAQGTTQSPPPPQPSVTISKTGSAVGQPGCTHSSCAYMRVQISNMSAAYGIQCKINGALSFSYTTNNPDTAICYFGFPGASVTANVNGVESNTIVW